MRLLIHPPAHGTWNMAVDEALLASAASSEQATLRLYAWSPATLSLGYFQAAAERELHAASNDCPLVRRASGGGAILHDRELTYSLTMPCSNRFGMQATDVYRRVHESLIATFATWGIKSRRAGESASLSPAAEDPFLCFARRSPEDIVVGDAKIVGSAQRRHHGALLQHGSILLAQSDFAPELPGLMEAADLPDPITVEELTDRWLPQLQTAFATNFEHGELTVEELQAAKEWEQTRFATDDWNRKR